MFRSAWRLYLQLFRLVQRLYSQLFCSGGYIYSGIVPEVVFTTASFGGKVVFTADLYRRLYLQMFCSRGYIYSNFVPQIIFTAISFRRLYLQLSCSGAEVVFTAAVLFLRWNLQFRLARRLYLQLFRLARRLNLQLFSSGGCTYSCFGGLRLVDKPPAVNIYRVVWAAPR